MKTTLVVTIAVLLALIVPEADCFGALPKGKRSEVRVNFYIKTSSQKTRLPLL